MPADIVVDKWGNSLRPRKNLVFILKYGWGGMKNGIWAETEHDDRYGVPTVHGIVWTIREDCVHAISRLPREEGGLMPGDLILYPRYSPWQVTRLDLESEVESFDGTKQTIREYVGLYAIHEDALICRVDGILPDPYELAKQSLDYIEDTRQTPSILVP